MSVVKRAMMLLLLAAIGTNAALDQEGCENLNKTLPTKDLHKIFGSWVLVWADSDSQSRDIPVNISSSHVELRLLPDNTTITFNERNMFEDKSCSWYFINMSMPANVSGSEHHTLHTIAATVEKDGVGSVFNDSGKMDFYETECSNCMAVIYSGTIGRFVLLYRREGYHQDVEELKAARGAHEKRSRCLGFPLHNPFSYDGVADFCPKKSPPALTPEQS